MLDFESKIKKNIGNYKSFLVTLSGGADSVSLLHCLNRLGLSCIVAHCNFHLRGEESNRDEKFAVKLCKKLGVEIHVRHFDVESYCSDNKVSIEMACRDLRYAWFRELRKQFDCDKIAVAHNADDNIETMLLNLFRGTGIDGLTGMSIESDDIIRPLITSSRSEIEQYLRDIKADHITDSTNLQSDFKRNYIRNILLPQLETRWPGIRKSLAKTLKNLQGTQKIYSAKIAELIPKHTQTITTQQLLSSPDPETLLFEFLKPFGTSSSIIEEMIVAITENRESGKRWRLNNYEIILERDGFHIITPDDNISDTNPNYSIEVVYNDNQTLNEIFSNRNHNVIYIPAPIENYRFRHPKIGDRIYTLGMKGSSLVSDILKDAKLTTLQRRHIWILEEISSEKLIWIAGLKRSRFALISKNTKEIIKLTLY